MTKAYLNQIGTAVPPYDIHRRFSSYAAAALQDPTASSLFRRMVNRAQIEHRYSVLSLDPAGVALDGEDFYRPGAFPGTAQRMAVYRQHAFALAQQALDSIDFGTAHKDTTHLIITSCTGFYAPGLDLQIQEHYGLSPNLERSIIGFMGCYAAFNALKLARHIVRSDPAAKVAIVNLELCTLHLQDTQALEQILSFLIFGDGCAASIVTAQPSGLELVEFASTLMPDSSGLITWAIGGSGFDMVLSGEVPATITDGLRNGLPFTDRTAIDIWAVHPGGRSVLDAVQKVMQLPDTALQASRTVLSEYGNMSSATVMFVLREILLQRQAAGENGCAMAFGPGVTMESLLFRTAAAHA